MPCHVMASRAMPGHIFACHAIFLRVMPCHDHSVPCRVRIFLEKMTPVLKKHQTYMPMEPFSGCFTRQELAGWAQ